MKLFKYIYIAGISLVLFGCSEEFLDLAPVDSATMANFYKTQDDFEAAIIGVYANWRDATVRPPMLTEYRADNFTSTRYYGYELAENDLTPNIGSTWWSLYTELVYPSNVILDQLENAEDIDPSAADRIKGEALFFRGYAYYYMNLVFGGVPLVTGQINTDVALQTPRASEAEVWQQAANDFQTAAGLLPDDPEVFGRIDKYAALAFLARVRLQQRNWSEAATVLADIYQNSGHSLEPIWTDLWTEEAQKSSDELMLTSIFSDLIPNNDFGQQFLMIDGDPTTQGNFDYKPGLLESFEPGDIRKDETVGLTDLGNFQNNKYDFGKVLNNWTMDVVVLRFTDIVLMYAEALSLAAGSPQQESLDLINMVRERAGLDPLTMADVPTLDAFVEAVLAERRAEFLFEATRFADLKRHDKLLEKLAAIGYNYDENYLLIPIPQSEIDKMPDVLVQNPGYN